MTDALTSTPRAAAARRRRGCLSGGGCLLAVGAVLLLLGAGGLFYAVSEARRLGRSVSEPFTRPQPTAVLLSPTVIIERLRGASELTTAISTVETVVDASQDRTLGPFTIGRKKLLYVAHGDVRAGVDLAALTPDDVTVGGDTVTIRLPPPRILDSKVDVARSRVFDVDTELLAPLAPDLQSRAERFALERIVMAACEGGVLLKANQQAEVAVRTLLESTGHAAVRVVSQPPAADACPKADPTAPSNAGAATLRAPSTRTAPAPAVATLTAPGSP